MLVRDEHFVYAFSDGSDLPGVLARWRQGNVRIASSGQPTTPSNALAFAEHAARHGPQCGWIFRRLPPCPAPFECAGRTRAGLAMRQPSGPSVASALPARPSVSAVIVTHDSANEIETCREALHVALEGLPHHLVVVDNASTDATTDIVSRYGNAITLHRNSHNAGFAGSRKPRRSGMRHGLRIARQSRRCRWPRRRICLRSPGDSPKLEFTEDRRSSQTAATTLSPACRRRRCPECLGVRDRSTCVALALRPRLRRERHQPMDHVNAVEALCGAFILINTAVWRELGGFDELFVMYGEDVDFCQRALRRGYTPLQATAARYLHVAAPALRTPNGTTPPDGRVDPVPTLPRRLACANRPSGTDGRHGNSGGCGCGDYLAQNRRVAGGIGGNASAGATDGLGGANSPLS